MRQSQLFTKTRKEAPKDEVSKNASLLIRAGFIHKEMSGVYDLLPLGLRVVDKIIKVVREEMENLGSVELSMSTLQNKDIWEKTGRWGDERVDVWFKSKLKNETEVGFGWSHEEPIVELMKSHVSSYHDLPVVVHQFQNKLRNETRAKSGIMRGREFLMKDMYCLSLTEDENNEFYNSTINAYKRIFEKIGIGNMTYVTRAPGGLFTDNISHEFQTICEAGEDNIYINEDRRIAFNENVFNEDAIKETNLKQGDFELKKAVEVGNIFNFGTKKSEELELYVKDSVGESKALYLSSYGIGITRLLGTLAEVLSDESGLVWPFEVSPFQIHLLSLSENTKSRADEIYEKLISQGVEVLYDDRDARAGEKFADADLIGISRQVIVGDKFLESERLEVKSRMTGEFENLILEELLTKIK